MPWQPLFKSTFIRPIRENMEQLVRANEAAALAIANDGDPMEPFKVYRKALWYNTLWPVVSIVSQSSALLTADDGSRIGEVHSILVETEIAGPDPDKLAENVERRVQALDMIIRSAEPSILRIGLDPNAIAVSEIEIPTHDYTQFTRKGNQGTIYLQAGSLIVNVTTVEAVA